MIEHKRPTSQIRTNVMVITPTIAEQWLHRSPDNYRKRSRATVLMYATDIRNHNWRVNGETIKLAVDGTVLDGQHRLAACVEAKVPFTSLVALDVEPSSIETIDTGKSRGTADLLSWRGEKSACLLAGVITWLAKYKAGTMTATRRATHSESLELLEANPDIRKFVSVVANYSALKNLTSPSISAFCYYLFWQQDQELAVVFFDALNTGLLLNGDEPVYLLRERLMKEKSARTYSLHPYTIVALFFKAWNATVEHKKIRTLFWRPELETFPTIVGAGAGIIKEQCEQRTGKDKRID